MNVLLSDISIHTLRLGEAEGVDLHKVISSHGTSLAPQSRRCPLSCVHLIGNALRCESRLPRRV